MEWKPLPLGTQQDVNIWGTNAISKTSSMNESSALIFLTIFFEIEHGVLLFNFFETKHTVMYNS